MIVRKEMDREKPERVCCEGEKMKSPGERVTWGPFNRSRGLQLLNVAKGRPGAWLGQ